MCILEAIYDYDTNFLCTVMTMVITSVIMKNILKSKRVY